MDYRGYSWSETPRCSDNLDSFSYEVRDEQLDLVTLPEGYDRSRGILREEKKKRTNTGNSQSSESAPVPENTMKPYLNETPPHTQGLQRCYACDPTDKNWSRCCHGNRMSHGFYSERRECPNCSISYSSAQSTSHASPDRMNTLSNAPWHGSQPSAHYAAPPQHSPPNVLAQNPLQPLAVPNAQHGDYRMSSGLHNQYPQMYPYTGHTGQKDWTNDVEQQQYPHPARTASHALNQTSQFGDIIDSHGAQAFRESQRYHYGRGS